MKVRDCIFFQLSKASQAGSRFWTEKVKHLNVTATQAMVLNFLGEEDRILPRELRQKLMISSATMTGILDRLEKLKLIERHPHPQDRRAILVCLTGQGAQYAGEINTVMVEANEAFLGRFSSEESQTLREMLKQVQTQVF